MEQGGIEKERRLPSLLQVDNLKEYINLWPFLDVQSRKGYKNV